MTRFDKVLLWICGFLFVVGLVANGAVVQDGKNYVGLSSDVTPTTATVGSRFYETDTRKAYLITSAGTRSLLYASPTGSNPISAITSAPAYTGQMSVVSGAVYLATGTTNTANWKQSTSEVFYTQATPSTSVTGTTTETTLYTTTIPGGIAGSNGVIEISWWTSQTNNANPKSVKTYFNSTNVHSYDVLSSAGLRALIPVVNTGSESIQTIMAGAAGFGSSPITTVSVNTASDITFTIKATLNTASDTLTLRYVGITIKRGD